MTTIALYGKLRDHEIEINMLNEQESHEIKVKNIALKSNTKRSDETEEEVAKSSENENLNLLVKRFGKYLKRKYSKVNQKRYNPKLNDINNILSFSCYNCGKEGHIKLNVQTLTKEKRRLLIGKRRTSPRKGVPTLLGKIMTIQ